MVGFESGVLYFHILSCIFILCEKPDVVKCKTPPKETFHWNFVHKDWVTTYEKLLTTYHL